MRTSSLEPRNTKPPKPRKTTIASSDHTSDHRYSIPTPVAMRFPPPQTSIAPQKNLPLRKAQLWLRSCWRFWQGNANSSGIPAGHSSRMPTPPVRRMIWRKAGWNRNSSGTLLRTCYVVLMAGRTAVLIKIILPNPAQTI